MVLPCQPKAVARLLPGLGPAVSNTAGAGSSVEHLMQAEHSGGMLCLVLPETHYVGTTCFRSQGSISFVSMATPLKARR